MDILNAVPVPVGDRVYRLIPVRGDLRNTEEEEEKVPCRPRFEDDDYCDPDLPIMHQGDRFYISFHIPDQLISHIIGHQGKRIKLLEQHGAKIDFRGGKQDKMITISGSTRMVVYNTYQSVVDRVTTNRLRIESTHFISFPVNSPNIQESFLKFKAEILEKFKRVRGIDESIFQKPSKLHLTVAPLVLLDERDNQNAIAILTKCRDNVLKDFGEKEFVVQVKGIEYMNDDPAEVDVLYAEVQELDDDNSLQIIADNIMKEFCDANLSKKQYDKVKFHITLMNTLFRAKLENKDENESERETFDCRPIFKDYKDYDFGQIVISEVHISVRYTGAPDGYYMAIKKVKLNL